MYRRRFFWDLSTEIVPCTFVALLISPWYLYQNFCFQFSWRRTFSWGFEAKNSSSKDILTDLFILKFPVQKIPGTFQRIIFFADFFRWKFYHIRLPDERNDWEEGKRERERERKLWDDKSVRNSRRTRIRSCVLVMSNVWAASTGKRISKPLRFLWLGLSAEVTIFGLYLPTSSTLLT
jgi:hypothetical protein